MLNTSTIQSVFTSACKRWDQPHPEYTSGFDSRSSEQGMLALFYGGLAHAADYNWLNAGRALIDKTYLNLLWQVEKIPNLQAVPPEKIAMSLDQFIRNNLAPVWHDLTSMEESEQRKLSKAWTTLLADSCFGSIQHTQAASYLAFYLFPMLPVIPFRPEFVSVLNNLGFDTQSNQSGDFFDTADQVYRHVKPRLQTFPAPQVSHPNSEDKTAMHHILNNSDWWHRRLFVGCLVECSIAHDA